jgi:inner membrane protein
MDNITHSLVGAIMGQAGLKQKTGLAMPALIIGANLPDVDAACFYWLEGAEHLGFRRGITHGPPAMVLLPLILAGLLWAWDRWQARRGTRPVDRLPVRFTWLYLLSLAACITHPALDWLNVYGIRLLEPFSSRWFYGDTLFIIDVWLWAVLAVSLWLSRFREKRGGNWTRPAWAAIVIGSAYILANGIITRNAEKLRLVDDEYGETIASPVPLAFWQRERVFPQAEGRIAIVPAGAAASVRPLRVDRPWDVPLDQCRLADAAARNSEIAAFVFWSRAPFATRTKEGTVTLHDARFYDPRARDRFSVVLPEGACAEQAGRPVR